MRLLLQYGIGVVVLIFYVTASLHFRYTPDDTYVSMQYGRNLARGDGLSFNAGVPDNSVNGPLWVLLIAAGAKLNLDPYIVAKTLDLVFASFSLIAVLAFAFIMIRDRIYALVAAWIFSFDAWFLLWSGTGSGASLALLLVMLAIWYAYKKEYVTSSFIIALLTLVRLEGCVLLVPVLLDAVFNARGRAAVVRAVVGSLVTFCAIVVSWFTFSYAAFGTGFPGKVMANVMVVSSLAGYSRAAIACLEILGATQFTLAVPLIIGIALTIRKKEWLVFREEGFPLLWLLMLPALFILMRIEAASSQLLLVVSIIVVYGVWGVKRLETVSLVTPRGGLTILLILAGISLAQNQFLYQTRILPQMENFELGVNDCLKPMAYWLRSNSESGATVLTPDAGIIGYISERRVYETEGKISPDIKDAFAGVGYDEGMTERRYERVLHPDYIIDRSVTPERLSSETIKPVMTRAFPGISLVRSELVYYTLYKVAK